MRKILLLHCLMLFLFISGPSVADEDDGAPGLDVPGQEQKLNAELWRFAKNTSYEALQKDLKETQEESKKNIPAEVRLPTGWRFTPAGNQLEAGRYPLVITPFAGNLVVLNNGYYVETNPEVSVVSGDGSQVLKTFTVPSLFPSAKVGPDGILYISGGYDQTIRGYNDKFEEVRDFTVNGYSAGLAPVGKSLLAVAYMLIDNNKGGYKSQGRLALINTQTGELKDELDCGRMPYALEYQDGKLFASLLQDDKVAVYSAPGNRLKLLRSLPVGKNPTAFAADPKRHRLYVINQNSDEISVLDTLKGKKTATWNLRQGGFKFGVAPTSGYVLENRLFVTLSRYNALAVLNLKDGHVEGFIPTGWYPTCVTGYGQNLYTLSAKGIHERRPNAAGPQPTKKREEPGYVLTLLKGSVGTIPLPDLNGKLGDWTQAVTQSSPIYNPAQGFNLPIKYIFYIVKENRTYDQVLGDLGKGNGDKDLTIFGKEVTPNHHQMAEEFVDLDNFFVDGEISVLGHSYTTSAYASPFLEWLGMNDYAGRLGAKDATNPRKNEDFWPFGTVPFTFSPSYIWDSLDSRKVDYRIYGEDYYVFCKPYKIIADKFGEENELTRKCYDQLMAISKDKKRDYAFNQLVYPYLGHNDSPEKAAELLDNPDFLSKFSEFYSGGQELAVAVGKDPGFKAQWADFLYHYAFDFAGWDLSYSDLGRVACWQRDFQRQLDGQRVFPLQYIWLPNDHTAGMDPKSLNPNQFLAQNDAAVGIILDTISKSPVWKDSLVFCIEDDSQNGPDHVDAMRSIAFAVGPNVKRQSVVSDLYDQLGMLRTMELILGLEPMNMNDGMAAPMFSIFTDTPDLSPYNLPPPSRYLTEKDREIYEYLLKPVKARPSKAPTGSEGYNPTTVR